eukprot:TRINITY_DN17491_c0_g1_i2.p1 TRINITY_DN17491_c0_g1~~TRINITY_DN17491_c0_g1_i2.p1  ORF type:complete len:177 (+),score=58.16 TRINITY_DN17491_c0_g1_i2:68-598(+)
MIRRPPRSTLSSSSAASDVYKRQVNLDMGGGYYEDETHESREVYTAPTAASSTAYSFSTAAAQVLTQAEMHSDCNPFGRLMICRHKNPIIVALDVTGSMGNWSKVIYDKLPMLFGQLMLQDYLDDPAICFAAVGDANSDEAPLQAVSYTHLRAHETPEHLVCRLLLEKKKKIVCIE